MKKINLPSFLYEYGSAWNPLIMAFQEKIIAENDESHTTRMTPILASKHKFQLPMIERQKLDEYGARLLTINKNDTLFHQGGEAQFYFQLLSGSVKMTTNNAEGQEFIQGIFKAGDSFGEPPLFCDFPYPSTAVAIEDSTLMKLPKQKFLELLRDNFDIHLMFDRVLCNRLKYKAMVLTDISFHDPEQRIENLLHYIKESSTVKKSEMGVARKRSFTVPFTRQQIADMSGLRVETVIRTVKKMQKKGKLEIVDRKINI